MHKKTVAVLFGGVSSEHDISLISAASVIRHLSQEKYHILKIGITKKGHWMLFSGDTSEIENGSWETHRNNCTAFLSPDSTEHGLVIFKNGSASVMHLDVVFPVLHGKNGEDGTLQGLLQMNGIPFVGCDMLSSANCMDKAAANILLEAAGVPQAEYLWLYADEYDEKKEEIIKQIETKLHGYPVFVKPSRAGSSVGVSKVHSLDELDQAIATAAAEDSRIVIEEGIIGQEVECAVLGNRQPQASVVGEIGIGADFYDYNDKYVNGVSQLFIPARIPEETAEEIRQTAVKAYRFLGCNGLSRVDFFVRKSDGRIFLNEINTLPGFTSISMYPKLWEHSGIPYGELLDHLIDYALQK